MLGARPLSEPMRAYCGLGLCERKIEIKLFIQDNEFKYSSIKCRPFCVDPHVLKYQTSYHTMTSNVHIEYAFAPPYTENRLIGWSQYISIRNVYSVT